MIEQVTGLLLGLFALTYTSYITWHSGYGVWGLDTVGEYTAQLMFPGESDLRHAFDKYKSTAPPTGSPTDYKPPCDLCGDNEVLTGHTTQPTTPSTWTGAGGKQCKEWNSSSRSDLNPVIAMRHSKWIKECGNYRPSSLPPTSLLTDQCTAVAGLMGIPDHRAFVNPREYISLRLFGMSNKQLYASSIKTLMVAHDPAQFPNGSPYQNMREQYAHTYAKLGESATMAWDTYYIQSFRDNLGLRTSGGARVFIPPQLVSFYTRDCKPTWFAYNSADRDYYNPLQWLIPGYAAGTSLQGALSVTMGSAATEGRVSLADFCRSQKFQSCYAGYTMDSLLLSACEWTPDLHALKSTAPSPPGTVEIRGLLKWTDAEARLYIDQFMQFDQCRGDTTGFANGP